MEESKDERVIDNVISHAALAWVHYDHLLDVQFQLVLYESPVWGKNDMWESYYYQIFDDWKDMLDNGMHEYLETLRK